MLCRRLRRPVLVMKRKLAAYLGDSASVSASSSTMATPTNNPDKLPSLRLTPGETKLRSLLLSVVKSIDAAGDGPPVVLRWAGGWVRDKLLGIQSHDIDVAINTMTGEDFADRAIKYCATPQAVEEHGITDSDIKGLYKVQLNPDHSKHLATASFKLFGLDLDFVNLRRETYADDSRNPQVEFGTAEEDASRRDATINALFYNLNADSLEDFTNGWPDLRAGIIRTPLEPLQTFQDDPLRVLRLVRFASRLQFTIQENTERYMGDSRVLEALRIKIKRERVGIELEKMLKGKHPRDALELIDRLKLYHAIFTDPSKSNPEQPDISRWHVVYRCLDSLLSSRAPGSVADLLIRSEDATYIAWNTAIMTPWATIPDALEGKRKASALPLIGEVAREGYRAPNKVTDLLAASQRHRADIMRFKKGVCDKEKFVQERDTVGMAIRLWEAHGGSWRLQVLSAFLVEAFQELSEWAESPSAEQKEFMRRWQLFFDHLTELDVWDAPNIKRLLDGRELSKALGVKPGRWTGQALEVCMAWQLRNPQATDPAGAIEEVRRRREELEVPNS